MYLLFRSLFFAVALCGTTSDSPLLPSYKLCVDALRRFLPPHRPRLRFHL